jgi:hypothetical protein
MRQVYRAGQKRVWGNLRGGIGNQLFQVTAYLAIAKNSRKRLVLKTQTFQHPSQIALGRRIEILPILQGLTTEVSIQGSSFAHRLETLFQSWVRKFGDIAPRLLVGLHILASEKVDLDFVETRLITRPWYVDGYFAFLLRDRFYLNQLEEICVSLERLRDSRSGHRFEPFATGSLAIHIRLGDFRKDGVINPLGEERLSAAINMSKISSLTRVILFSDEPELASRILADAISHEFEIAPSTLDSLDTLLLMSTASKLICSESTYSWWSAYLAWRNGATVVFPVTPPSGVKTRLEIPSEWGNF